jgi:hypothetical protein
MVVTGNCLCGGVHFQVHGELSPIQICHCQQCRKAQGSALVTNIPVSESAFTLLSGAVLLQAYESSPGKQRVFCGRCGSPIYSRRDTAPGVLRLRAGLLNEDLPVRPVAHFHVAAKANWWTISDRLPQFPEALPPDFGGQKPG